MGEKHLLRNVHSITYSTWHIQGASIRSGKKGFRTIVFTIIIRKAHAATSYREKMFSCLLTHNKMLTSLLCPLFRKGWSDRLPYALSFHDTNQGKHILCKQPLSSTHCFGDKEVWSHCCLTVRQIAFILHTYSMFVIKTSNFCFGRFTLQPAIPYI